MIVVASSIQYEQRGKSVHLSVDEVKVVSLSWFRGFNLFYSTTVWVVVTYVHNI